MLLYYDGPALRILGTINEARMWALWVNLKVGRRTLLELFRYIGTSEEP